MPTVQHKYKEKRYFDKLALKGKDQWALKGKNYTAAVPHDNPTNPTYPYLRSVLDCSSGAPSTQKWDLMQVELNSLREEKADILDYYGSTLVQFGYITMFSPSFSLGPLIALIANLIDIKYILLLIFFLH